MNITLKKLTPELMEDFLYYFDHIAFSDHEEWAFCYCLECHLDKQEDEQKDPAIRRAIAQGLIMNGEMQGYLAYDGDDIVGWCSANDKMNYKPVCTEDAFRTEELAPGRIKAVYCFDIAPDYRSKGLANLMLDKVCQDAKEDGYIYIEAYPFSDVNFSYQYHGTISMYERHGFELYAEREWMHIMRKKL